MRTTFDFPVIASQVVDRAEMSRPPRTSRQPIAPPTEAPRSVGEGTPWRHVTLAQLIDAGLIRLPFAIEHRYRGVELAARIESASRIMYGGQPYDSLSTAGGVARKSVAGSFPGRDIPQTNGWTFWQCRAADGRLITLDELRRELYERKVINLPSERRSS